MRRRSLVGSGFSALGRWRLILLLTATAAILGGIASSPLAPAIGGEIGGRLAGDHMLRNDPARAPVDVFDFLREKRAAVSGWRSASLWAALAGLVCQIFFTGGIVATVGRPEQPPGEFWSASRRHFAHNAKCFALAAAAGGILLSLWIGGAAAAGKSLLENVPPHAAVRVIWGSATLFVASLIFAAVALLGALAKADRRVSPAVGALAAFRHARRRLRGNWLAGFGILLLWSVAGAAALALLFGAAWYQVTPNGPSVAVNLLLLALSLTAIPAAKVAAWGSILELLDRTEEETRAALRKPVEELAEPLGVEHTAEVT